MGAAAWAFFTGSGQGQGAAAVGTLAAPSNVAAVMPSSSVRTVRVTWTAPVAPDGSPVSYLVSRSDGSVATAACGTGTTPVSGSVTCNDTNVPSGTYTYTVTVHWRSWTAASAPSAAVTVATAVPTTTFTVAPLSASLTAGSSLPVTVTAVDQYGDPYPSYTGSHCLTFGGPATSPAPANAAPSYPAAGGCTGASAVIFNAGVATPTVTLYAAESTTLVVMDPSTSRGGSANISVAAGAAHHLALTASTTTPTAGSAVAVSLAAHDAYDNVITAYTGAKTIAWSGLTSSPAPSSRAPTYPATTVTFSGGINTTSLTVTAFAASLNSLTATDGGGLSGSLPLAVSAGTASQLAFPAMSTRTAGGSFSLTLTAADAYSNPATYSGAKTLAWSGAAAAPNGTLPTLPTSATFAGGATTVTATLVRAETLTLAVSDGTLSGTSGSFLVGPGAAAKLAFTVQPTNAVSTIALSPSPTVAIQDSLGNIVTSDTRSLRVALAGGPTGGVLSGTTTVSAASGAAPFPGLSVDKAGSGYTLVAVSTDGLLTTASSSAFTISVGPASRLLFSAQPSGATSATGPFPIQPAVTVQDAGGNTVTTYNTGITLALAANPNAAALTCTSNPVTPSSGVANFAACHLNKTGVGYTLTASSGALSVTSAAFNVTGIASKLVFTTSPNGGTSGVAWTQQPAVAVEDAASNIVTADSGAVALTITTGTGASGASLACASTTVSASYGIASFSGCSIVKAGTAYKLTAAHASTTAGTSTAFDVVPGAPTTAQFTQAPGSGTLVNIPLSPQPMVTLLDANGNIATNYVTPVTLSLTSVSGPGGASLSCTTNPVPPSSGVATFSGCAVSQWGTYRLTAATGAVSVTTADFDVYLKTPALALTNKAGGTARQPEPGDQIAITYPDPIPTSTFCGGWNGAAPLTQVTVSFTSTGGDQITGITDAAECTGTSGFGAPTTGIGGIAFGTTGKYFSGAGSFTGSTAGWNAGTNTLTITLGALTGAAPTKGTSTTASYTPNGTLGLPSSVATIAPAAAAFWF
jgi:hypothetical protein